MIVLINVYTIMVNDSVNQCLYNNGNDSFNQYLYFLKFSNWMSG